MARYSESFESGVNGANVGAGGTSFDSLFTSGVGGAAAYDNTRAAHGDLSVRFEKGSGGGAAYLLKAIPGSKDLGRSLYVYFTSAPPEGLSLAGFYVGTTRIADIRFNSSTKLRITMAASSSDHQWTATSDFPLNQWVRVDVFIKVGTTTSNGQARIAYYAGDDTAAVEDSGLLTAVNAGTADITDTRFGVSSTIADAVQFWADSTVLDDDAIDLPGPWDEPPGLPVISVSQTDPTTTGGSDGTVTVTWAPVANADYYEAALAAGHMTDSFVVTDSNATSPKVFTGLTAGNYTVAVRGVKEA